MLTCRACGVEPFAWLRQVLTELPQRPDGADIEDLLSFFVGPPRAVRFVESATRCCAPSRPAAV